MTATSSAARTLAVVPGDGIGPEVVAEALKVLEAVAPVKFEATRYDLGAERYLATGEVLPDSVLEEIRGHDAIVLGAVGGRPGDPKLPAGSFGSPGRPPTAPSTIASCPRISSSTESGSTSPVARYRSAPRS